MKNKLLLEEEIQKFKKLSGIIDEATTPTNWISSLISKVSKTALPDVVVREFEPLVNAGKIGINKSTKTITMIDWAKLTDDEVKLLFRSDELVDIMEEIIKANGIKTSPAAMMAYKGNFKKIMTGYVAGKAESRITSSAGSQAASTGANPNALRPNTSPAPTKPKTGELPADADEIIAATAKSSPEAAAYMRQIESFGFSEKITKILQLEYGKAGMANKTADELIEMGNRLSRQLSEKEYGWLKRIWSRFEKNPAGAIDKAGKASYKLMFWVTILILAASGVAVVLAIKNWFESKTGTSASDLLPSIPDAKSETEPAKPKKAKYD